MPLTVNWWLVKSGLKHGMGTERALGRGGAKAEAERARLAVAAPTEPVMPADRAQDASEPVHDVKAMLGMSGMGSADMPPQAHTADTHRATGDAPVRGNASTAPMSVGSDIIPQKRKLVGSIACMSRVIRIIITGIMPDITAFIESHSASHVPSTAYQ